MQLLLESFGHQLDADKITKWTQLLVPAVGTWPNFDSYAATIVSTIGPRGGPALRMGVYGGNGNRKAGGLCVTLPASGTKAVFGFYFRCVESFATVRQGTTPDAYGNIEASCVASIRNAGVAQFWLNLNTSGLLEVYRGTTKLGTSSIALTQNVYSFVELEVVINSATGTVSLKINGAAALTLTGQNTQNAAAAAWDEFRLAWIGYSDFQSTKVEFNYADVYVCDGSGSDGWTSTKGPMRIDPRYATADGATTTCTRSTGATNFGTVDETQGNSDTDYNTATAVGNKDTFTTQDAPVAGGTVLGVQVVVQAKSPDAGATGHKAVVRIGGVDYLGTEYGIPVSYAYVRQGWGLSPATGVAWTEAEFNAAEFGYTKSS